MKPTKNTGGEKKIDMVDAPEIEVFEKYDNLVVKFKAPVSFVEGETIAISMKDRELEKDQAYKERDMLVRALSKIYPAHLCRHPEEDKEWEDDWRWIVCVHINVVRPGPSIAVGHPEWVENMQVTWHIHDSEREWFDHLEVKENHWDGHSTEEKYKRLFSILPFMSYEG